MASTMRAQATVRRLRAVDLLQICTQAQLEEVACLAERIHVGEGEVLAREGRIGREFFLILSGWVAVTQNGRRVNTLGQGNFFGELAAMDPGPRNATVTALSDLDVLIIGPREFSAMTDIPGFRDALFRSMASRLRNADARLAAARGGRDAVPAEPGQLPRGVTSALRSDRSPRRCRPTSRARTLTTRGHDPPTVEEAEMGPDSEAGERAGSDRLHGVPWFTACSEEQLLEMARVAEPLRIQAGEVILREGRLGRELFVILEGTATVTRTGRVVNVLHAGDYFGELAAIEAAPRSATVTATTDLDVLIVGPREFEAMMEIPGFRNALLSGMSRRIREADDRLAAYIEREDPMPESPGGDTTAS